MLLCLLKGEKGGECRWGWFEKYQVGRGGVIEDSCLKVGWRIEMVDEYFALKKKWKDFKVDLNIKKSIIKVGKIISIVY